MVGINEGGVAASVVQGARVDAGRQGDGVAAVGDDGQGGGCDLGEAVDGLVAVRSRCEGSGDDMSGVSPEGVVSGAVGIGEPVGDGALTIVDVNKGVQNNRGDVVAAYVLNGRRCVAGGVCRTRHCVNPILRHVGDSLRHNYVESEGPRGVSTSAVYIGVSEGFCSFTVGNIAIDNRIGRLQRLTASIGNYRQ